MTAVAITLLAGGEEHLSWPDAVVLVAALVVGAFFLWVMARS